MFITLGLVKLKAIWFGLTAPPVTVTFRRLEQAAQLLAKYAGGI